MFKSSPKGSCYCIDCLLVLNDENYIIVSNWNGEINKIDVRLRKSVLQYQGHKNNHSEIGFQMDTQCTNLFAVGSDSCVRVWDVGSGRLEHQHRVVDACKDRQGGGNAELPIVEYSDCWGGDMTNSGLLCMYGTKYQMWPLV